MAAPLARRVPPPRLAEVLTAIRLDWHVFKHVYFSDPGRDMTTPSQTTAIELPVTVKAQQTRERIFGAAMELFKASGFEKTTMRMIADRAGVNVALSYRYFPSKEHLVFEFYRRFSDDFIAASAEVLEAGTGLESRLIGVAETMFAAAGPYHGFAGSLFATAASPASPLNPFSESFTPMRDDGIALCARVIDGCRPRVPEQLAEELPFLLWVFNLGLLYCWMHDHSEHQEKTRTLLRQSVRLIAAGVRLGSTPGSRYFLRQVLSMSHLVRSSLPLPRDGA
jgi:AcrR family transcriptional regulator